MRQPRRRRRASTRSFSPEVVFLESRLVLTATGSPASNIGINLNINSAWSGDPVWVDVHNLFRSWGPVNDPWASSPAAPVNSDGYPLAPASTLADLANYPAGLYQLSYQGTGTVAISGMGALVGSITTSNGVSTGTVEISPALGTDVVFLTVTGVSSTATISNFHLYAPGYGTNPTQIFTNQFLQQVEPFSTIRFVNWMQAINSTVTNWSDRTPPTSFLATGASGVPYEDMIALANETQRDMWINIPALTTPAYVQSLAQLISANLDPNLHVYLEYSNETWNAGFNEYYQVLAAANANPLVTATNDLSKVAQQSAYMEIQDARIFQTVFGSANTQVIPVFAGWAAVSYYQQQALQWVQSTYGSPANYFKDLAIAPYIYLPSGVDVSGMTLDQLFAGLNQNLDTTYVSSLQTNAALAASFGLPLATYEGGQSMTAVNGLNYAVNEQAKSDPRMFQLYVAMIQDWKQYAGSSNLFMDYVLNGADGNYGFFALLPTTSLAGSQEYDALMSMLYPAGDADRDGVVGYDDFQIVQQNFGQTGDWWSQGVFNGSGVVNWASVNDVRANLDPQNATLAQFAQMAVFGQPSSTVSTKTPEYDAFGATYVSDMPWASSYSGSGSVQRDLSSTGNVMWSAGFQYAKGLGVQADSQVVVNLNGQYAQFQSDIGLNGWSSPGSVVFEVYGDGKLLYDSGTVTLNYNLLPITVNVTGVRQLTLDVVSANGSTAGDSADWAAARLISTANFGSAAPYAVSYSVSLNGRILTTQATDSFVFPFTTDGTYTITATATDSSGNSASASTTLAIGPYAPWTYFAVPGNGQVQLEWVQVPGAASFDILRGTSPSALSPIADGVTGYTYSDVGVSNGTTYYYEIVGVDVGGDLGPPTPVFQAMPTALVTGDVYVSDMPFLSSSSGSGSVQRDLSSVTYALGTPWYYPLRLGWAPYWKGLGVQANSMIAITTNGAYATFKAVIGVNNWAPSGAAVVFMIRDGLGNTLYTSPVMTNDSAPISIDVSVANTQQLMLYATASGASSSADYADWASARLVPVGFTYVGELPFANSINLRGPAIINGSAESPTYPYGGPMVMGGNQYMEGIGVSPYSNISIDLNGGFSTFVATIGFDNSSGSNPLPIAFGVYLDGKGIFWSGTMDAGAAPQTISLNVQGGNVLTLVSGSMTQYGFQFYNQYADWALAELWK